jgi:isoleucyl-tRNA synthetase
MDGAISDFANYIRTETQALTLTINPTVQNAVEVEMEESMLRVKVTRK